MQKRIISFVPLWKFHLDGDAPLRLNHQISIRKLTRKEKADTEFHAGFMLGRPRFCIHCVSKRGKDFGWGDGKEQAEKVIQAMRLFSTGDVGAFIRVDALNAGMSRISLTPALMTDRKGDIYHIAINLRDEFIKFCTEYTLFRKASGALVADTKIGLTIHLLKPDKVATFDEVVKKGHQDIRPLAPPLDGEFMAIPSQLREPPVG